MHKTQLSNGVEGDGEIYVPPWQNPDNVERVNDRAREVPGIRSIKKTTFKIPPEGAPVPNNVIKKAGPYLLGPKLGPSPVKSIVQCLARKEGTDEFYLIKILTLRDEGQVETQDDRQGKMLLHTEYSLLSLLENQDGVIHHHGLFKVTIKKIKHKINLITYQLYKFIFYTLDIIFK